MCCILWKGVPGQGFDDGSMEIRLAQFYIIATLYHCQTVEVTCAGTAECSAGYFSTGNSVLLLISTNNELYELFSCINCRIARSCLLKSWH